MFQEIKKVKLSERFLCLDKNLEDFPNFISFNEKFVEQKDSKKIVREGSGH